MLNYNRKIIISAAGNRKSTNWPQQEIMWTALVEKLKNPVRSTETLSEYLKLPKSKQDDLKDVGGFVAGSLKGNKRGVNTVIGRDIITLDLDNIAAGQTQNTLLRIDGLGCGYCVYSTRKHDESKPRLRVLVPLNRTATADEYEPLARKLASIIGIELCDPTTFQASRLMYWPSCCSDSQYVYKFGDKPFLSADGLLGMYHDWKNINEWPEVPGTAAQNYKKLAAKQGNPLEKPGIVGAFCKTYDIYKAIEIFIPDAYDTCDIDDRLTFTGGSTTGGAIIYENGNFLYSHHATDPAGSKLCNAFDLVRYHLFAEKDDEAKPDTPTNKLPSYAAMCELAKSDEKVKEAIQQQNQEQIAKEFGERGESVDISELDWTKKLMRGESNIIRKTFSNLTLIIQNDPILKNNIYLDEFKNIQYVVGSEFWKSEEPKRKLVDADYSRIKKLIEEHYGLTFRKTEIVDAVDLVAQEQSEHEVRNYFNSLEWDGVKRVDTLLIDYLGAEDTPYNRAIIRKVLCAAVARIMKPGEKFDNMPILTGPQGVGKSTMLKKLGKEWFSDSLTTFSGKEAAEMLQGIMIFEIGELNGMNRSETNAVKQFLSKTEDIFRPAYGRNTVTRPRQCVFIGTTNDTEFLKDPTGARRFWPVEIRKIEPVKDVFTQLDDEVDQIWAEAFYCWQQGESLLLPKDIAEIALERQKAHEEVDTWEGIILEFIKKPIPEDWNKRALDHRRMYWSGEFQVSTKDEITKERDSICAMEIWCECFNRDKGDIKKNDAIRINNILKKVDGALKVKKYFGIYGEQRGFTLSQ